MCYVTRMRMRMRMMLRDALPLARKTPQTTWPAGAQSLITARWHKHHTNTPTHKHRQSARVDSDGVYSGPRWINRQKIFRKNYWYIFDSVSSRLLIVTDRLWWWKESRLVFLLLFFFCFCVFYVVLLFYFILLSQTDLCVKRYSKHLFNADLFTGYSLYFTFQILRILECRRQPV